MNIIDDSKREWRYDFGIANKREILLFETSDFSDFSDSLRNYSCAHTHSRAFSVVGDDKPAGVDYTTRVTSRVVTACETFFVRAPPTGGAYDNC